MGPTASVIADDAPFFYALYAATGAPTGRIPLFETAGFARGRLPKVTTAGLEALVAGGGHHGLLFVTGDQGGSTALVAEAG